MKNGLLTTSRRLLALLMMVIAGLSALAASAAAQTRDQNRAEFHESYPLAPNGIVSVGNASGNIRVTSWNENRVQVDAIKHGRQGEDLNLVEIQVNARPERVEISTIYPSRLPRRSSGVSVDYEVKVPRSAVLNTIKSASGDISVQGAVARVVANSSSGKVTVQDVTGDANLSTSSGNITAERIGGTLITNTASGNLQIYDIGVQFNARSASGNIQATQIKDDARVETASGNVRLEHVGGRATATTASGSVTVRDVSGDVRATTASEPVTVESVRGRATAISISGRIVIRDVREGVQARSISSSVEISNVKGQVEVDAHNEGIVLREIDSRNVKAVSHNGHVRFQGKIYSDGHYDFQSYNGNIILTLPVESGFTITAITSNGEFETDFPIQLQFGSSMSRPRRVEGTYGKGGAQISATGLNGTIYLKKQ